jgi:methionyl-tRNA formyltransferase
MKKKIVYMGTKDIGAECFLLLIKMQESLPFEIIGALTNDRAGILEKKQSVSEIAKTNNIPLYKNLDEWMYAKPKCDIIISVQYHEILKPEHINIAGEIAINLHMAPLPEYRGCNQFSFAIIDNAKEFGTTLHKIDTGIDSGDIIAENRFDIAENIDVTTLYRNTYIKSVELFSSEIPKIITGNYILTPQSSYKGKRKSTFHLRKEIDEIKKINISWDKEKILRYFRATYFPPFSPPYYINDAGEKINITQEWIAENMRD